MIDIHPPISALLFDLDDTLNDRAASFRAFVPRLQEAYALRLGDCDAEMIERAIIAADQGGYRPKETFFDELQEMIPWKDAPASEELEQFWRSCFASCMVERAGAKALLTDLRNAGFRVGIVTNGREDMQRAKIASLGLDSLVQAAVISEGVGIKKPDARIFQAALDRIGSQASSTLVVGDHPVLDVAGAKNAGMRAAWLSLGRNWPSGAEPPDFILSQLQELRPILRIGEIFLSAAERPQGHSP